MHDNRAMSAQQQGYPQRELIGFVFSKIEKKGKRENEIKCKYDELDTRARMKIANARIA